LRHTSYDSLDEAQRNPGAYSCTHAIFPDFTSLHPGYITAEQ